MKTSKKKKPKILSMPKIKVCEHCAYLARYYHDVPMVALHEAHQPKNVKVQQDAPPVVFVPPTRDWMGKKMVSNPVNPLTATEDDVSVELLGTDDKSIGFWCECLRDEHEAKGEHLKVSGLISYAFALRQRPYADRCALRDAIQRIYADERKREHERDDTWLQRVQSRTEHESYSGASSVHSETQSPRERAPAQQTHRDAQTRGERAPKAIARPGVIAKIVEVLRSASKRKPVTKEQILDVLVKTFPERARDSMRGTIGSQIPKGLWTEKKIRVRCTEDGKGFWIRKEE